MSMNFGREQALLRQRLLRVARRELTRVDALLAGDLLDLVHGDRDLGVRLDQQLVFGKEPGEQHPVPMLVSDLLCQPADGLRAVGRADIAELPTTGTQAAAQIPLGLIHRFERFGLINRE